MDTDDVEQPLDDEEEADLEDATEAVRVLASPEEDAAFAVKMEGRAPAPVAVEPTQRERFEGGLQDTLDLSDWRMPCLRDYLWYLVVYGVLISLSVYVIWRYRMLWAYVLWGGYLVVLLVLAGLIVRSLSYRRGTFSKTYSMATLDLQQAVEEALDIIRATIDFVDRPQGGFLRPIIAVYRLHDRRWTVTLEGRPHLHRKVVRVGRFSGTEQVEEGRRLCIALDGTVERLTQGKRPRALFRNGGPEPGVR